MKFSDVKYEDPERTQVDMSQHWGCVVYARPVTVKDHAMVARKHEGWPHKTDFAAMVTLLMEVAQDEAGEPFFELKDKPRLLSMPMTVMNKAFQLIAPPNVDEIEKN